MTRLASRMMHLTTGKSIDKKVSKTHTAPPFRYQNLGVCMVCLDDIEVPDPSALAAVGGNSLPEHLPSNLIHREYMITLCEHTFHIFCWKSDWNIPRGARSALNPFPWMRTIWIHHHPSTTSTTVKIKTTRCPRMHSMRRIPRQVDLLSRSMLLSFRFPYRKRSPRKWVSLPDVRRGRIFQCHSPTRGTLVSY
jgi:hypothetical protein